MVRDRHLRMLLAPGLFVKGLRSVESSPISPVTVHSLVASLSMFINFTCFNDELPFWSPSVAFILRSSLWDGKQKNCVYAVAVIGCLTEATIDRLVRVPFVRRVRRSRDRDAQKVVDHVGELRETNAVTLHEVIGRHLDTRLRRLDSASHVYQ